MMMVKELLIKLKNKEIVFNDVISYIESKYIYVPTAFKNGEQENASDQNQGSAKVFAFAKIEDLSKEETLNLFAEHYQAVLDNPNGIDHQNIRQFMLNGWAGIEFDGVALVLK